MFILNLTDSTKENQKKNVGFFDLISTRVLQNICSELLVDFVEKTSVFSIQVVRFIHENEDHLSDFATFCILVYY